jgi:hypothetical protein
MTNEYILALALMFMFYIIVYTKGFKNGIKYVNLHHERP